MAKCISTHLNDEGQARMKMEQQEFGGIIFNSVFVE